MLKLCLLEADVLPSFFSPQDTVADCFHFFFGQRRFWATGYRFINPLLISFNFQFLKRVLHTTTMLLPFLVHNKQHNPRNLRFHI
jgi:hypothetical protein